jgi:flagellar biosynthesis chaperone FliJ
MAKKTTAQVVKETEQYVAFLEKRLASKNYKANVSAEEFKQTQEKLSKARTRLKLLKPVKKK